MATFGLKIVKQNKNINSLVNRDFIIKSELNALKIFKEESLIINYTASSGTVNKSILHGLNFTPTFLAYFRVDNTNFLIQHSPTLDSDQIGFSGYADSQFLNFTVSINSLSSRYASNQMIYIYYYILADTAREFTNNSILTEDKTGIKISKPNKLATSNKVEDMLLTTRLPSMKIHKQGLVSITSGGTAGVSHGLPFAPAFIIMVSDDNITYSLADYAPNVDGPSAYGWSDKSTLNLRSFNFPGQTHYFKYIIFANRAGLR